MGSPPTSGAIEMIHKNQSFKELLSQRPVQKGRMKAIQPRIENSQRRIPQSLFFAKTTSQATPNASKTNLFKAGNECALSKNSLKAVKFDRGKQLLALRCVSRLGVASQASFVSNEKLQRKSG
jgi:hypothetical protein